MLVLCQWLMWLCYVGCCDSGWAKLVARACMLYTSTMVDVSAPLWLQFRNSKTGVRSQQVAKRYGLHQAINLAAHRGCQDIGIVGDNVANLQQVVQQRVRAPLRCQQGILRRIHHALRWGGVSPRIYWVASKYDFADAVSKALHVHTAEGVHAKATRVTNTPTARPVSIGSTRRRG